jgi:hypothetical protein
LAGSDRLRSDNPRGNDALGALGLPDVLEGEFVQLHGTLPNDYDSSAETDARLRAIWSAIHALPEKRAALCISGGGIRSATFGLGVLQGLAGCGLLDKFHYLSTVSGGGYIGSWLSAWIKHHLGGVAGVITELRQPKDSALNPEPQPIRYLRQFSNYLTPRTGLTSVDFWTLIATFIRNVFLNWLVLISWLAAAMMIPRLFLVVINLQPDWSAQTTSYLGQLSTNTNLHADWTAFWGKVFKPWDLGLTILLAAGFVLIAVAMAYAIIDVPSTGNAQFSQRRFLKFRQLPLFLASVFLAAWWAVFFNVHGSEPFSAAAWLGKISVFFVLTYLCGGVLGAAVVAFRKRKAQRGRFLFSLSRLGMILLASAFAGLCLGAMATRLFLEPKIEFAREYEAIIGGQKKTIAKGTATVIKRTIEATYTVALFSSPQVVARISEKDFDALELTPTPDPGTGYQKFVLKGECDATTIPRGHNVRLSKGSEGLIIDKTERTYTLKTVQGLTDILKRDLDVLELQQSNFTLIRDCEAKSVPSGDITIRKGATGKITGTNEKTYTVKTDQYPQALIAKTDLYAFDLNPAPTPAKDAVNYICFAPALIMAVLLLVNFLFTGLTSWVTKDEDREWWGRSAAWILITIVCWVLINSIVLWGAQAITQEKGNQLAVFLGHVRANPQAKAILGAFGGVSGIVGALLGLRSKLSQKLGKPVGAQWPLVGAAVVFFILLSIIVSWILLLIGQQPRIQSSAHSFGLSQYQTPLFGVFCLTLAMAIIGIVMGLLINANTFSLHATYRNRLIRAYLAASRAKEARKPHRFTGFDPADNFPLCDLATQKPLHVLNGALNLVRGEKLAWQERKAESFTMSRLHCGSWPVGYRPADKYGAEITLGTAMAISGAAANPSMGSHSSPVVGFLMTLFNLRLGWWLGNPGKFGAKTWDRSGPRYSVGPLFSEATGNTTDRYKYVNLSDGGHFENLGLYEMVLRRCHYIVVSDAGQDPECSFADLGEAVRKIRVDFGIPIEFDSINIYPRSAINTLKTPGRNCAIGRIRYSVVDGSAAPDGVLVYIKPACYGNEPRDIYEYFKTNPTFPHETTANQFFAESQFESYRMLGAYTVDKLCDDCAGDFPCFIGNILERHLEMKAPEWLGKLIRAHV